MKSEKLIVGSVYYFVNYDPMKGIEPEIDKLIYKGKDEINTYEFIDNLDPPGVYYFEEDELHLIKSDENTCILDLIAFYEEKISNLKACLIE